MNYQMLTYMMYNEAQWYAAIVALFVCGIAFLVILNVIQFEVMNRLELCHPYFFQSDACRKLIRDTIAADANFAAIRKRYKEAAYTTASSAVKAIQTVSDDVTKQDDSILVQLGLISDSVQKLGAKYLGNLQTMAQAPAAAGQSLATQLKTLLDATVIDPAMIKYKDPLTRLYNSLVT